MVCQTIIKYQKSFDDHKKKIKKLQQKKSRGGFQVPEPTLFKNLALPPFTLILSISKAQKF